MNSVGAQPRTGRLHNRIKTHHALIIMKPKAETKENAEATETILFEPDSLCDKTFLSLPLIEEKDVESMLAQTQSSTGDWENAVKNLALHRFGVKAESVISVGSLLVIEGCEIAGQIEGPKLIALDARPYDARTWHLGYGQYRGRNLYPYFTSDQYSIDQFVISLKTLYEILSYRTDSGKLPAADWADDKKRAEAYFEFQIHSGS